MAYGGLETGPGEGPSAPLVCWELPPGARLAQSCVRTQPAQRSTGDSPLSPSTSPPGLSHALGARGGEGRGGEAIWQGLKRVRGGRETGYAVTLTMSV